jgi:ubiquinone/menaquinone biosynthesis C-methylase UbiE
MADLSVARVAGTVAALEFLAVDEFLRTLVDARALKTAFELGLIDRLTASPTGGSTQALGRAIGADPPGLRLLLDLLTTNAVIEERAGDIRLTRKFRAALRFRDLMETKLDFVGFVLNDFADLFTALVRGSAGFMGQARLFQLFDYRRCLEYTPENYVRTRAWMRITTVLSRYEADAAMLLFDFSRHRRVMDVGGNSGEFILRLCRRHPDLTGTVFDLPLVCEIGMEHVLGEAEHDRISFIDGDARTDLLPGGFDLICFKSMLHDWPAREAALFLTKATRALAPGGTILIFERGPMRFRDVQPPLSLVPYLLFARSYRPAAEYTNLLAAAGFEDIRTAEIDLDSRFFMVTGRKPGGAG